MENEKKNMPQISDDDFTDEELDLLYGTHFAHIGVEDDVIENRLERMGCYG